MGIKEADYRHRRGRWFGNGDLNRTVWKFGEDSTGIGEEDDLGMEI